MALTRDEPLPTAEDMEFRLFGRALHPELFEVVAERHLQTRGMHARVWLVAGGHVVETVAPGGVITEVAIGRGSPLPHGGLLGCLAFRGERGQEFVCDNGMHYHLSLQVEQLSPPLFAASERQLRRCGPEMLWHVHRRYADSRSGLAPFSYLDVEIRPGVVLVSACHTFPAELTIIRSQSLLEWPPPTEA